MAHTTSTPSKDKNLDALAPRSRYLPEGRSLPTAYWPGIGDFIVITVDPVASVGHLDKVARRAARRLPKHRFVALAISDYGLPLETKPFTHYLIALVRRGLPTVNNPPWSSPDMCYPISPNTYHPTRSETIQPIHPFPLANCYIDTTAAFLDPICCRITTSPRDYTPVLPMSATQLSRLRRLFSREVVHLEDLVERLKRGDLEVIASLPLPSSPVSASEVPPPSSLPSSLSDRNVSSDRASVSSNDSATSTSSPAIKQTTPEEVSIIGSDDSISLVSDRDEGDEIRSEDADRQLFEMMRFETMMNDTGDPRDPVVHVSYDLGEVDEVTDPVLFIKVRDQLRSIIDEAELRLGIRVETALPEHSPTPRSSFISSVKGEQPASILSSQYPSVQSPNRAPRNALFGRLRDRARRLSLAVWHRLRGLGAPCHSPSATTDVVV